MITLVQTFSLTMYEPFSVWWICRCFCFHNWLATGRTVTEACSDIGAVTCQCNYKFRCWRRIAETGANLSPAFRCWEIESRIVSRAKTHNSFHDSRYYFMVSRVGSAYRNTQVHLHGSSDISCSTGNINYIWEIFFRTSKSEIILEVIHEPRETEFFNTSSGSCGHSRQSWRLCYCKGRH